MKMIVAVIRSDMFQQAKQALEEMAISGMTVSDVQGHGRQKGHTQFYRGSAHQVDLLPKMQLEIVAPDEAIENIVQTIVKAAHTGEIGDGKIFVVPVEQAVRVRTGETGDKAA